MICLAEINEESFSCRLVLYGVFLLTGLLYMGLAIPMILRKIPPNQFYGWRTPKAFSSKEIWYEINWYCGRDFFAIGLFIFIFNLIVLLLENMISDFLPWFLLGGNLAILIGGIILMVVRGCFYLKRL